MGLPTAAAYIGAGGIAWGGAWAAAEDATAVALGREERMGSPGRYVTAAVVGAVATALLFPLAAKSLSSGAAAEGVHLAKHAGTVESFLNPARSMFRSNVVSIRRSN